jgi:hypothetical protein
MRHAAGAALLGLLVLAASPPSAGARWTLVVCAPGYPGTTAEARPTMDAFATALTDAVGWKPGDLAAVYHETLAEGVARLGRDDAALAMVTLPFYLQESARLKLAPRAQVLVEPDGSETWSLVAKKGTVASPASLEGWEVVSIVGQFPDFIRGPVLGKWGPLPASTRITYAPAVLAALRRASMGEKTAVLLDAAGAGALPALSFAGDLETVARSAPLAASLVCTVGDRLPAREADRFFKGLLRLNKSGSEVGVLTTMRTRRFEPVDTRSLKAAQESYARVGGASR